MARGIKSADIDHPLFHDYRGAFFSYNKRRDQKNKPKVSFERYLQVRGIMGPRAEERALGGHERPPERPRSTKANVDPVYLAHKNAFQGYNNQRKLKGLPAFTFEEYLDHISKPRKVEVKAEAKKERDYTKQWEAENARRAMAGQLPLKYVDFVRDWKDWI